MAILLFVAVIVFLSWWQTQPSPIKRPPRPIKSVRIENGEIVEVYEKWSR